MQKTMADPRGYIYARDNRGVYKFGWQQRIRPVETHVIATKSVYTELNDTIRELAVKYREAGYILTHKHIRDIFAYITKCNTISRRVIINIVYPDDDDQKSDDKWYLRTIKEQYNNSMLIKFPYQRTEIPDHCQKIKEYIMTHYMESHFIIPPMVFCYNEDKKNEIIDGMHRCIAISQIPDDEPCMQHQVVVLQRMSDEEADRLTLFQSINRNQPIKTFEVSDGKIDAIRKDVAEILNREYKRDVILVDSIYKGLYSAQSYQRVLHSLLIAENLQTLYNNDKIKSFEAKSIYTYIKIINEQLIVLLRDASHESLFSRPRDIAGEHITNVLRICNKINSTNKRDIKPFIQIANTIASFDGSPFALGLVCPKQLESRKGPNNLDTLARFMIIDRLYEELQRREN